MDSSLKHIPMTKLRLVVKLLPYTNAFLALVTDDFHNSDVTLGVIVQCFFCGHILGFRFSLKYCINLTDIWGFKYSWL